MTKIFNDCNSQFTRLLNVQFWLEGRKIKGFEATKAKELKGFNPGLNFDAETLGSQLLLITNRALWLEQYLSSQGVDQTSADQKKENLFTASKAYYP